MLVVPADRAHIHRDATLLPYERVGEDRVEKPPGSRRAPRERCVYASAAEGRSAQPCAQVPTLLEAAPVDYGVEAAPEQVSFAGERPLEAKLVLDREIEPSTRTPFVPGLHQYYPGSARLRVRRDARARHEQQFAYEAFRLFESLAVEAIPLADDDLGSDPIRTRRDVQRVGEPVRPREACSLDRFRGVDRVAEDFHTVDHA